LLWISGVAGERAAQVKAADMTTHARRRTEGGHTCLHHLFAPSPRCLRFVEAHRGNVHDRQGMAKRRPALALRSSGLDREDVPLGDPPVLTVALGRQAALVARVGVQLEVELDHLGDCSCLSFVGLFGVEVEQEAPQAVPTPALRRHVVLRPGLGMLDRRERATSSPFVVVVEAERVGLAPALGDVRPCGPFPPRPSHPLDLAWGRVHRVRRP
jgi:hypothetical protein